MVGEQGRLVPVSGEGDQELAVVSVHVLLGVDGVLAHRPVDGRLEGDGPQLDIVQTVGD